MARERSNGTRAITLVRLPALRKSPYPADAMVQRERLMQLCRLARDAAGSMLITCPPDAVATARSLAGEGRQASDRIMVVPDGLPVGPSLLLACMDAATRGECVPMLHVGDNVGWTDHDAAVRVVSDLVAMAEQHCCTIALAAPTGHGTSLTVEQHEGDQPACPIAAVATTRHGSGPGETFHPIGVAAIDAGTLLRLSREQERVAMKILAAAVAEGSRENGVIEPDADFTGLVDRICVETVLCRSPGHVRMLPADDTFERLDPQTPDSIAGEPVRLRNSSPQRDAPPRRTAIVRQASRPGGCLWRLPQAEATRPAC